MSARPDRIEFNITDALVNAAHTIDVASVLPAITEAIVIDGTTDPDFSGTPLIVLNGSATGNGLELTAGSDGSTIRGLAIGGFSASGLHVADSSNHIIQGNYFGVNATGTQAFGNGVNGLRLENSNSNQIGGSDAANRNIFGGNSGEGLHLNDSNNNTLHGNYFGLAETGTSTVGNSNDGLGVYGTSTGNQIGGSNAGEGNTFAGNANNGIEIGATANNNSVRGNFIGVTAGGVAFGNNTTGIRIHSNASSNTIGGTGAGEGNVIANNSRSGISTSGNAANNLIIGNSIHSNGQQGIDVGHDDAVTADTFMPVLNSAVVNGTDLRIEGTISGNTGEVYTIAFYSTDSPDANGYGEGKTFLNSFSVTISATGTPENFVFDLASVSVPAGHAVTATASTAGGQTSEFALNVTAMSPNQAPTAGIATIASFREGESLVLDAGPSSDPENDSLTFEWDIDGDGIFGELGEPTSETATIDWATLQTLGIDDDGVYDISVQVSDGTNAPVTATQTVTVTNTAPTLNVTGAQQVGVGSTFTLNLEAVDFGNDSYTWTVNWGDGEISTATGNVTSVDHVYSNGGFTNNITVSAVDENGNQYSPSAIVATGLDSNGLFFGRQRAESGNPNRWCSRGRNHRPRWSHLRSLPR